MNKILFFAFLEFIILCVVTYFLYIDYGWVISLTVFTIMLTGFYIVDILLAQHERLLKIANFLDYQFGEGYIDSGNYLHKKGEPVVDLSKEEYDI